MKRSCSHSEALPERVRGASAWVAARAGSVTIEPAEISAYAGNLPDTPSAPDPDPATELTDGDRETRTAFAICLDAINFGSGWWPTIRKRPGHSGYFTIAAGLTERFRAKGAWTASELAAIEPLEVAAVLGQEPTHPLMADYAAALRDVGEHARDEHGGRFASVVDAAGGSAVGLAEILAGWPAFADVSEYDGRSVPFFKRAQIVAADIDRMGLASQAAGAHPSRAFRDLDRLTAFADNVLPHVLRVDGVLRLAPALEARIEAGELLEHGSPEEVELRACAVHVVELLATTASRPPAEIDAILWNRGRAERYKSRPRPRSRNTAY